MIFTWLDMWRLILLTTLDKNLPCIVYNHEPFELIKSIDYLGLKRVNEFHICHLMRERELAMHLRTMENKNKHWVFKLHILVTSMLLYLQSISWFLSLPFVHEDICMRHVLPCIGELACKPIETKGCHNTYASGPHTIEWVMVFLPNF